MEKVVRFVSKSRGFGGDNYFYESTGDNPEKIVVAVGWALLAPHLTTVTINGKLTAKFKDKRYVQPDEALQRLGYQVVDTE